MIANKTKNKKVYYSGIGSHNTPEEILNLMEELAYLLAKEKYVLRSGGSQGADTAFEAGADRANRDFEIYLPWKNFRNREGKNYIVSPKLDNYNKAVEIAKNNHPGFEHLTQKSKKLIIRDTYQVLGKNLNCLSEFVICWTADGCITDRDRSNITGGTGQAISIASKRNIPIFNLKLREHKRKIKEWVSKIS